MKRSINIPYTFLLLLLTVIIIMACETTAETYKEFTKDGEKIYVGTPDTVIVAHGFEKLQFSVVINADPKISNGVIQTKDKSFLQEFDVNRQNIGQDTVSIIINLDEGEYNFDIYLKDDAGNSSIPREVTTLVYGAKYQEALLSRSISDINAFENSAVITWGDVPEGSTITVLSYEDADGVIKTIEIPNNIRETSLPSYKLGGQILINSSFLPTPDAIEAFISESGTKFPDQFKVDHTNITALRLPFDASDGCNGSSYEKLTDGETGEFWHSCETAEDQYPFVMSFDIGITASISGFRLDKRSACCGGRSPGNYQIWATNELDGAETVDIDADGDVDNVSIAHWEADATAKGWVKLFETTDNTLETFEVDIPENGSNYRYVRIVAISSINGETVANFDEFTFFASDVE